MASPAAADTDFTVDNPEHISLLIGPAIPFLQRPGDFTTAKKDRFIAKISKPFQGAGHPNLVFRFTKHSFPPDGLITQTRHGIVPQLISGAAVVSLILVADQERLVRLFGTLNEMPGTTMKVVSDIEALLAAPPDRGLRCIAIQERLGEVAGEILAQRLAAQLKGRQAKLVLLGTVTELSNFGKQPALVPLDPNLPDDQLLAALQGLLFSGPKRDREQVPQRAKKKSRRPKAPVDLPAAVEPPPVPVDDISDTVSFGRHADSKEPISHTVADCGRQPRQSTFAATLDSALSATEETEAVPTPTEEVPDKVVLSMRAAATPPSSAPVTTRKQTGPLRRQVSRRVMVAGLLVAGLGIVLLALLFTPGSLTPGKRVEPGKKLPLPAPEAPLVSLPAFIPPAAVDPAYSKSHPGWERYGGSPVEFRVFRESGVITAIQVFDRSGRGLPGGLFTTVLLELSGSSTYLTEQTERQGAYQVERGRLGNGKRIIIYRTATPRQVRAFVIDLR